MKSWRDNRQMAVGDWLQSHGDGTVGAFCRSSTCGSGKMEHRLRVKVTESPLALPPWFCKRQASPERMLSSGADCSGWKVTRTRRRDSGRHLLLTRKEVQPPTPDVS